MVRSRASREEARAFEGATVGRKRMLHNGAVTVRWQGIGCPELRYGRSIWYRQHWGQAPSVQLVRFCAPGRPPGSPAPGATPASRPCRTCWPGSSAHCSSPEG